MFMLQFYRTFFNLELSSTLYKSAFKTFFLGKTFFNLTNYWQSFFFKLHLVTIKVRMYIFFGNMHVLLKKKTHGKLFNSILSVSGSYMQNLYTIFLTAFGASLIYNILLLLWFVLEIKKYSIQKHFILVLVSSRLVEGRQLFEYFLQTHSVHILMERGLEAMKRKRE